MQLPSSALLYLWFTFSSNIKSTRLQEVSQFKFLERFTFHLTCNSAYTIYAFFEWSLVLFDVAFDAVTAIDFETFELVIKDVKGSSKGYVHWLPK